MAEARDHIVGGSYDDIAKSICCRVPACNATGSTETAENPIAMAVLIDWAVSKTASRLVSNGGLWTTYASVVMARSRQARTASA